MNLLACDSADRLVALGKELARGGEGSIFELPNHPGFVAKIYHVLPSQERADKLRAMVRLGDPELSTQTAWPVATLHRGASGPIIGFVMPRIEEPRELHLLTVPMNREQFFPRATWAFLVRTALNAAIAFDVVHARGLVVGDVNDRNLVVSPRATVRLIDVDSWQVGSFTCDVGVETFTPPELQGCSLEGRFRTANHDDFGLAVILFQLLFLGRHPYAGRYTGPGDPPTLDRMIREHRFAYGKRAADFQVEPPPGSLGLGHLTPRVAALFERAFSPGALRPEPYEWKCALLELEYHLRECPFSPGHPHADPLRECPWCAFDRRGGPAYFVSAVASAWSALPRPTRAEADRLGGDIERIPPPRFPMPDLTPLWRCGLTPAPLSGLELQSRRPHRLAQAGAALSIPLFAVGFFVHPLFWLAVLLLGASEIYLRRDSPYRAEAARRRRRDADAFAEVDRIVTEWRRLAAGCEREFVRRRWALRNERARFDRLVAPTGDPSSPAFKRAECGYLSEARAILFALSSGRADLEALSRARPDRFADLSADLHAAWIARLRTMCDLTAL